MVKKQLCIDQMLKLFHRHIKQCAVAIL